MELVYIRWKRGEGADVSPFQPYTSEELFGKFKQKHKQNKYTQTTRTSVNIRTAKNMSKPYVNTTGYV
jgi:hypothetical protein